MRKLPVKRLQRRLLLVAREYQHRHRPAQRYLSEGVGGIIEERPAGERQRPHQPVAKRIMEHGRAAPGRMETDLLFGLDHGNPRMFRKRRSRRKPGDPAADDKHVGAGGHACQPAFRRSWTTLPPWVRRMPLTISSSSGSSGAALSL